MTRHRDVIAVGASAGGVEALRALVAGLPPNYPGVLLVVLHMPRTAPSALPAILRRQGSLPVETATDGEPVQPGRIYVAPSDHHLLLLDGRLRLTHGPAENGHRPAIDPLFRSVARGFGRRAVGVVLSGSRDDGAAGLATIAAAGGTTIVQDPDEALYPWMPRAALQRMTPDHVAPADKIGGLLGEITALALPDDGEITADPDPHDDPDLDGPDGPLLGCPDCGGSLHPLPGRVPPRFRCRVGHAWSPESLLDEQANVLEGALWTALRALEDKSALSRRMAAERPFLESVTGFRFADLAADADGAAEAIRGLIARLGAVPGRDEVG